MLRPTHRLALFMQNAFEDKTGKMGLGVLRYSGNPVVCMIDSIHAGEDSTALTGVSRECPIVTSVDEAHALGAEVMILGIAPPGGLIPASWDSSLNRAVELGMSLVNGLHDKLAHRYPDLPSGQFVWDVRCEPPGLGIATGEARKLSARRLLMVGTDMSVGKMTAGLEIAEEARATGLRTAFVATGQIGIVLTGSGVALDAVRLDYAAGAIEREVLRHKDAQLIVVEGQGSLIHPSSSATLPLMRGSCPTSLVLCHRAGMSYLPRHPWVEVPPLRDVIKLYESLAHAAGAFEPAPVQAIALNTAHLDDDNAKIAVAEVEEATGLPCSDPVRHGAAKLLEAVFA